MKFLNYPYTVPITPIGTSTEWSSSHHAGGRGVIFQPPTLQGTEGSEDYLRRIGRDMPTEVRKQLLLEQQTVIDNFAKAGKTKQYNYLSWETVAMDAMARAPANTYPIWDAIDGMVTGYLNQDFGTDPEQHLHHAGVKKLLGMEVANQQQFIWDNFGPLDISATHRVAQRPHGVPNMHPNFEKLVSPYILRNPCHLEEKQTENRLSGKDELSAYNLYVDMIQHGHTLSGGGGGAYINIT